MRRGLPDFERAHRVRHVEPITGAVLAAGSGERMGRPKAAVRLAGVRLVDRAVGTLRAAGCDPVIAVVRAGVGVAGAQTVVNPDPARGMRSSLELAVEAAAGSRALAVVLVDAPGIGAEAVSSVCAAWRPGRIAVARYAAGRGHPMVMAPALWCEALALAGPDEGARALLARRPDLVDEVDVAGDPTDLDTPEDLARWTGGPSG
jgi:CTP:molybdopterin cytidylyltransferase MocA